MTWALAAILFAALFIWRGSRLALLDFMVALACMAYAVRI
jgi:hypothetical protein